ncbi:nucleotidyltransferase family protein [Iningainema tapete]|uniref:Nucleotidyltransferase family protein n=1 Tax=Iningainema tapete BLCC-T55 TaxID=2748662 RepID=A0A8J6XHF8_9CYAN|nr:nucleotidyltransferase family protein [Iningainema tapete]MBD2772241.1 nucleotidyltransferase family protein [Iningainema tapete BLCC-T55]
MVSVGAIILAAGASTRMGTPKQLLQFQGHSFLERTVDAALASVCQPVVVVLGAYAEKIRPCIDHLPVMVVHNPHWNEGMGASIRVGVTAINATCEEIEAVVLALCDQPFVSFDLINQLVDAYYTTRKDIIACEYARTLGVPALFSRKFFPDLINLNAVAGAKQVIKQHGHEVFPLLFPAGKVDIDTPEDYEQLQETHL